MPRLLHSLPTRRSHAHVWQRLPWNALFWVVTLGLTATAAFFTAEVELHRHVAHAVDAAADLHDGDWVDVMVVLNGDEIVVDKQGARARVRILGIRSFDPVVNEFEITTYGRAAVAFLEHWVMGHAVKLTFENTHVDGPGPILAYLQRDGLDVGRRMLEEGVSVVYTEFPFSRETAYLSSEAMARSSRRGLWAGVKAANRARGLRRDWSAARLNRTGATPTDPLAVE